LISSARRAYANRSALGQCRRPPLGFRSTTILGLDLDTFAASFVEVTGTPFLLIQAKPEEAEKWAELLGEPARRCYIADDKLKERAAAANVTGSQVVAATIPDPGSVMSGDFGEILTAFYFAVRSRPTLTIDPVRWRYKAQRTKAAPGSDVVQLLLPSWPVATSEDRVICAEVKAKATTSTFDPIKKAGEGSKQDRSGRLTNTLVWLKDKALTDGSDTVTVAQLDRFIQAVDHPAISPDFRAVAVIDATMVADEVAKGTMPNPDECALVVMSVPDLKKHYTALFDAIVASADAVTVTASAVLAPSGPGS
jgi:hypothetical protein